MHNNLLSQDILDCLSSEMNINLNHFLVKYNSFDNSFKIKARELLTLMLADSRKSSQFDAEVHYYEEGTDTENEFMQSMFDCFKELNSKQGLELHKALYEHTNRGGDNWFPVVQITSPVADYSSTPKVLTVYRGCHIGEFNNKCFRQSWSLDFEIAKAFAFTYFNIDKEQRVVIKATVSNSDIAWLRGSESEAVLLPRCKPLNPEIKQSYNQYLQNLINESPKR